MDNLLKRVVIFAASFGAGLATFTLIRKKIQAKKVENEIERTYINLTDLAKQQKELEKKEKELEERTETLETSKEELEEKVKSKNTDYNFECGI